MLLNFRIVSDGPVGLVLFVRGELLLTVTALKIKYVHILTKNRVRFQSEYHVRCARHVTS